jgi:hypothetical protein
MGVGDGTDERGQSDTHDPTEVNISAASRGTGDLGPVLAERRPSGPSRTGRLRVHGAAEHEQSDARFASLTVNAGTGPLHRHPGRRPTAPTRPRAVGQPLRLPGPDVQAGRRLGPRHRRAADTNQQPANPTRHQRSPLTGSSRRRMCQRLHRSARRVQMPHRLPVLVRCQPLPARGHRRRNAGRVPGDILARYPSRGRLLVG